MFMQKHVAWLMAFACPGPALLDSLGVLLLGLCVHRFPRAACWMTDQAYPLPLCPSSPPHSPEFSIDTDEILSSRAHSIYIYIVFLNLHLVEHTASTSGWPSGGKGIQYGHCLALLGGCTVEGVLT